jgi:large subunit ribosomal protein L22
MIAKAKSKYVRISPYKLRLITDVVRGFSVEKALSWLKVNENRRVKPIFKIIFSAYSNAKNLHKDDVSIKNTFIKEIRVDNGPSVVYFKPGAMGKASVQRKRTSHLYVVLKKMEIKK